MLSFYLIIAALVIVLVSGIGLWLSRDMPMGIVWSGSLIGMNISLCLSVYVVYDSLTVIWG